MTQVFPNLPLEGSRKGRNIVVYRLKTGSVVEIKASKFINIAFSRIYSHFCVYKFSKSIWFAHKPKKLHNFYCSLLQTVTDT
jgi:hypothetical protein